jgi:hypothetical protein
MFELLSRAALDTCAMKGTCNPAAPPPQKDITSSSPHTSAHGLYTAAQVKAFRECSNDFSSQFTPQYSGTKQFLGYKPVDGKATIETFRSCWEPMHLDYPAPQTIG